jgi:hypothetical protein
MKGEYKGFVSKIVLPYHNEILVVIGLPRPGKIGARNDILGLVQGLQ